MSQNSARPAESFGVECLGELLATHRERLRKMIRLRLDRRLNGRIDASDVIQEAYIDATRRFEEYKANPDVSPFVWLRFLATQKLAQLHRHHLGVLGRDAGREVSIDAGAPSDASSAALAAQLVGRFSSPSNAVNRAEERLRIQNALNAMEPIDREILALRHFEQLDNPETAEVLGIEKQAAYRRYVRAIRRLKEFIE
ncbi:MAG: sigma-70 family RNA polymerase sigma factor [Planctomycetaceae bacterium]